MGSIPSKRRMPLLVRYGHSSFTLFDAYSFTEHTLDYGLETIRLTLAIKHPRRQASTLLVLCHFFSP